MPTPCYFLFSRFAFGVNAAIDLASNSTRATAQKRQKRRRYATRTNAATPGWDNDGEGCIYAADSDHKSGTPRRT